MFSHKEKLRIMSVAVAVLGLGYFALRVPGCGSEQVVQESATPSPANSSSPQPTASGCGKVTFQDVKPLISQYCLSCHQTFDQYAVAKQEGPAMAKRVNLTDSDPSRMPKAPNPPLSQANKDLFTKWQVDGFLDVCPQASTPPKQFYNFDSIEQAIEADGGTLLQEDRLKTKYLVVTHKIDQGVSDADLGVFFSATHKAVNSLNTQNSKLAKLPAIGPQQSIFRLNLEDFGLSQNDWELIKKNDPFKIESFTTRGKNIKNLFRERQVWLHADTFMSIAHGIPEVYYALTRSPGTLDALVKKLGVDFVGDQKGFTANFLGTNNSPISNNKNRLVTQFRSSDGAFWATFDTDSDKKANQILFNAPLLINAKVIFNGVLTDFTYDFFAGEVIYSLRNGLSGYFLFDKKGNRLDAAAANVVRDNVSPVSSIIQVGNSCARCHSGGVITNTDEVRAHIQASASNFPAAIVQEVLQLYKEQPVMDGKFKEYNEVFQRADSLLGAQPAIDPLTFMLDRFQLNWDVNQAASFLFLSKADFLNALNASAQGKQQLGALLTGGTVTAGQIALALPAVIRDANLFADPLGK